VNKGGVYIDLLGPTLQAAIIFNFMRTVFLCGWVFNLPHNLQHGGSGQCPYDQRFRVPYGHLGYYSHHGAQKSPPYMRRV